MVLLTPLPRLAGVLYQRKRYLIHGWNAKSDSKNSYGGQNPYLGSMVLNTSADYTLLCDYNLLDFWDAEWAQDGRSVKLSFKDDEDLSLTLEVIPGAVHRRATSYSMTWWV